MVAQSSRGEVPLAALMLDLDHFKQINDDLGHAKGDEILAAFGASCSRSLRDERFRRTLRRRGVPGPAAGDRRRRRAGHRREAASRRPGAADLPHVDRTVTASIGVAVLPDHALDAETLERAADRALYLAKTNGRDRIELAQRGSAIDGSPGAGLGEPHAAAR